MKLVIYTRIILIAMQALLIWWLIGILNVKYWEIGDTFGLLICIVGIVYNTPLLLVSIFKKNNKYVYQLFALSILPLFFALTPLTLLILHPVIGYSIFVATAINLSMWIALVLFLIRKAKKQILK